MVWKVSNSGRRGMEEVSMDTSSKGMYNDVDNSSKGKENCMVGERKIVMS